MQRFGRITGVQLDLVVAVCRGGTGAAGGSAFDRAFDRALE
jgi:hypothetical protein